MELSTLGNSTVILVDYIVFCVNLYSYRTTDFDPLSASVILTVIVTYYIAPTPTS